MTKVQIIESAEIHDVVSWIVTRLTTALANSSSAVALNVPGGLTPFPILQALTHSPLDWNRLEVWPGDDRLVPEDHPASNVGRIRAALEPFGARIVALTEGVSAPHFALTWLGMGEDGHIASLFPNTDPSANDPLHIRRITPAPLPPEAPFDRLSMTIPALLNTDAVLFVIRGAAKRAVFDASVAGDNDLPVARLLKAAKQPVTCFA